MVDLDASYKEVTLLFNLKIVVKYKHAIIDSLQHDCCMFKRQAYGVIKSVFVPTNNFWIEGFSWNLVFEGTSYLYSLSVIGTIKRARDGRSARLRVSYLEFN